jgi:hypothetical protein
MIDSKTLGELEALCVRAKDYSSAFTEAVKVQAEKHQLDPQGLGRFVRAKVSDKLEKLKKERETEEALAAQGRLFPE